MGNTYRTKTLQIQLVDNLPSGFDNFAVFFIFSNGSANFYNLEHEQYY